MKSHYNYLIKAVLNSTWLQGMFSYGNKKTIYPVTRFNLDCVFVSTAHIFSLLFFSSLNLFCPFWINIQVLMLFCRAGYHLCKLYRGIPQYIHMYHGTYCGIPQVSNSRVCIYICSILVKFIRNAFWKYNCTFSLSANSDPLLDNSLIFPFRVQNDTK